MACSSACSRVPPFSTRASAAARYRGSRSFSILASASRLLLRGRWPHSQGFQRPAHPEYRPVLAQGMGVAGGLDDAPAAAQHLAVFPAEFGGQGRLPGSETRLPFLFKDLGDGFSGPLFQLGIQVDQGLIQPGRKQPAQGTFAAGGHPDQADVAQFQFEFFVDLADLLPGQRPVQEMLGCQHRLGHQHGQSVRAGDAPRLRLQQQGRAPGIVDDVQHPLTDGKYGQVHGRLAVAGVHAHRSGVHQDLRVSVAREVVIVVRTETGYHHDLRRSPLPGGGLGRQRRPAAAQNHDFFP